MSYNLAKFLRRENLDVTLYVDRSPLDESYSPSWEDGELNVRESGWIKEVDIKLRNS